MALLTEDAELRSDCGGRAVGARPIVRGRLRVARFLMGVFRKYRAWGQARAAIVNGQPGLVVRSDDRVLATIGLDLDPAGLVRAVYIVRNPDKLRRVIG